jgi:hypothetical protein
MEIGIVNFVENPHMYNTDDLEKIKLQVINVVKNKIAKLENNYNIKISFPKNLCNLSKSKPKLPTFVSQINSNSIEMLVPITSIISESDPDTQIENVSRCMRIVNSIKKDLEEYSAGKKTREQVDNTFFSWNGEPSVSGTTVSDHKYEIDEMYEKKFGSKQLLKKLLGEMSQPEYLFAL